MCQSKKKDKYEVCALVTTGTQWTHWYPLVPVLDALCLHFMDLHLVGLPLVVTLHLTRVGSSHLVRSRLLVTR